MLRQKQGVPEHDGVLDERLAGGRYFLLFSTAVLELLIVGKEHRFGESVGQLNLVQLLLNALTQFQIIKVGQDELRFDDVAKLFQCTIEWVIPGVGTQTFEQQGSAAVTKFDRVP